MCACVCVCRLQARLAAEKKGMLVAECEAELSKVMPPLIKALKELRAIDKASIAELKASTHTHTHTRTHTGTWFGPGRVARATIAPFWHAYKQEKPKTWRGGTNIKCVRVSLYVCVCVCVCVYVCVCVCVPAGHEEPSRGCQAGHARYLYHVGHHP